MNLNENEETQPNENQEPQEQEQLEQEQPQEQEQPEAEPKPEGEEPANEDGEPDEAETPEQAKAAAEEKSRRSGGWKRKIERLEREKQAAERERQLLIEQLSAYRPQQPQEPAAPKDPVAQMQEFVRAEARAALEAEREAQRQEQARVELVAREQEFRRKHDDYDDALETFAAAGVPKTHVDGLLTSEHGPAIVYRLAKNQAELDRFRRLAPFDAAREIGRLEALASSTAAPRQAAQPVSRPPVPPTSVPGTASSTRRLEDLPISEYKRAYRSGRR